MNYTLDKKKRSRKVKTLTNRTVIYLSFSFPDSLNELDITIVKKNTLDYKEFLAKMSDDYRRT